MVQWTGKNFVYGYKSLWQYENIVVCSYVQRLKPTSNN